MICGPAVLLLALAGAVSVDGAEFGYEGLAPIEGWTPATAWVKSDRPGERVRIVFERRHGAQLQVVYLDTTASPAGGRVRLYLPSATGDETYQLRWETPEGGRGFARSEPLSAARLSLVVFSEDGPPEFEGRDNHTTWVRLRPEEVPDDPIYLEGFHSILLWGVSFAELDSSVRRTLVGAMGTGQVVHQAGRRGVRGDHLPYAIGLGAVITHGSEVKPSHFHSSRMSLDDWIEGLPRTGEMGKGDPRRLYYGFFFLLYPFLVALILVGLVPRWPMATGPFCAGAGVLSAVVLLLSLPHAREKFPPSRVHLFAAQERWEIEFGPGVGMRYPARPYAPSHDPGGKIGAAFDFVADAGTGRFVSATGPRPYVRWSHRAEDPPLRYGLASAREGTPAEAEIENLKGVLRDVSLRTPGKTYEIPDLDAGASIRHAFLPEKGTSNFEHRISIVGRDADGALVAVLQ